MHRMQLLTIINNNNNVFIAWNKAVLRILQLPHATHTWLLGPVLNQCYFTFHLPIVTNDVSNFFME